MNRPLNDQEAVLYGGLGQYETPFDFSSAGVVKWSPSCWHSMKTYLHWLDAAIPVEDRCKV
jgi:hypothetical protein